MTNITAWVQEVRRLCVALRHEHSADDGAESVILTHGADPGAPYTKGGKPRAVSWAASCSAARVSDANTPEDAMRQLVASLRSQLAERIAKKRDELAKLERVQSVQLRVAGSDLDKDGAA